MSDRFKEYVSQHQDEFDRGSPGKDLWGKIEARLDAKSSAWISSRWLAGLKYLGLSASILVVVIYFVAENLNSGAKTEAKSEGKEIAALQNKSTDIQENTPAINDHESLPVNNDKTKAQNSERPSNITALNSKEHLQVTQSSDSHNLMPDPAKNISDHKEMDSVETAHSREAENFNNSGAAEKKDPAKIRKTKRTEITPPPAPSKTDNYTGTLYQNSSLCAVLQSYEFPGKANLDEGGGDHHRKAKGTVRTTSCRSLSNMANMKAVWVKGVTSKELTISIKKGFKNMALLKKDGKKIRPQAISHYYRGLGAILEYKGRYFKMVFKDKVDLILFFKDAEDGDKVVIDGSIEAIVSSQP